MHHLPEICGTIEVQGKQMKEMKMEKEMLDQAEAKINEGDFDSAWSILSTLENDSRIERTDEGQERWNSLVETAGEKLGFN